MQDRTNPTQSTLRRILLLAGSLGVGAVGWFLLGLPEAVIAEEQGHPGQAVVRIDGAAISVQEVLDLAGGGLLKLKGQRQQILDSIVNAKVRERLLELGAEEAGMPVDAYIRREVDAEAASVDESAVRSYYDEREASPHRRPLSELEPRIRAHLAMEALIDRLETQHKIEYLLDPLQIGS